MSEQPRSRRDRVRADTAREIKQTARRVLVEHGVPGLALRAIAREMGMTAPALYRYFASREELVEHVVADLYDELSAYLQAARDAAEPATPAVRLVETSRAFRTWATANQQEFGLLFGSAGESAVDRAGEGPVQQAGARFGGVFATLVAQIYRAHPFPVPDEADIDPALAGQLRAWSARFPVELPLGVVHVFLSCWIRLYGLVAMEIFGHLKFALADAEPMFEAELRALAERLGFAGEYRPARRV